VTRLRATTALRLRGTRFRPPEFKEGTYTIKVGEGNRLEILKGVRSVGTQGTETIEGSLARP
jgi:hypothetical protein